MIEEACYRVSLISNYNSDVVQDRKDKTPVYCVCKTPLIFTQVYLDAIGFFWMFLDVFRCYVKKFIGMCKFFNLLRTIISLFS